MKGKISKGFICLAAVLLTAGALVSFADNSASGSTFRMERVEGTASVSSQKGKDISITDGMQLYNGDVVQTKSKSYAHISLDSSKLIKLDELSKASLSKEGKKLTLGVQEGALMFEVKEKLKDDESMAIGTSTMSLSIRGTTGIYQSRIQSGDRIDEIWLLEGSAVVSCTGKENFTIWGGEKVRYSESTGKLDRELIQVTQLPGFAAVEVKNNSDLATKLQESSGMDSSWIVAYADTLLAADQTRNASQYGDSLPADGNSGTPATSGGSSGGGGGGGGDGDSHHSSGGGGGSGDSGSEEESSSEQQPSTEEPVTEEPSTEEPSTEEPSTEEPSTEEPNEGVVKGRVLKLDGKQIEFLPQNAENSYTINNVVGSDYLSFLEENGIMDKFYITLEENKEKNSAKIIRAEQIGDDVLDITKAGDIYYETIFKGDINLNTSVGIRETKVEFQNSVKICEENSWVSTAMLELYDSTVISPNIDLENALISLYNSSIEADSINVYGNFGQIHFGQMDFEETQYSKVKCDSIYVYSTQLKINNSNSYACDGLGNTTIISNGQLMFDNNIYVGSIELLQDGGCQFNQTTGEIYINNSITIPDTYNSIYEQGDYGKVLHGSFTDGRYTLSYISGKIILSK